ncbi:MAG: protein translocase subunit SecF [Phycisphaerae bacterium]|nr:protein translocase subunit SecF [Phycisphaerae bacterium]
MIGIVSSMFTALFVTRTIFDFCTDKGLLKGNLRMMQIVKNPRVNWMKARPVFWIISILLVVGGWAVFTSRDENKNSKYSIEFTGGTSIYVTLNDQAAPNTDRQDIEDAVNQLLTQQARVQKIGQINPDGSGSSMFEIVTTETNRLEIILTAPENSGVTADRLQSIIRQAAVKLGDQRLADETTLVTPAPQTAGDFLLETRQTNRNRVHDALNIALGDLTEIEYSNFEKTDNGFTVTLSGAGTKIDPEEIIQTVKSAARELRIGGMDQATVTPGQGDALLLTTEQEDQKNLKRVLDKVLVSLSPVQVGQMTTRDIVSDAVREALKDKLNIVDDLLPENVTATPITAELLAQKPYLQDYEGGLLLTARFPETNTQTLAQLNERFSQSRFRSAFEKYGPAPFGDEPALFAPDNAQAENLTGIELAIVSQELIYGGTGDQEWADFVNNETLRFSDTLKLQSSFTRVTQIDPSVGGKSRNEALVAIVFSLLAIVIYIWVRFGNVRFSLAAVAALVHDVSIAMGMVAASYWISQTAIGKALLISDFKIDLPMIAGFLTVIGYSLNDTIVVFDRIRENRGKMATLSASVVNNSINQTISRTILTSVTTLIVLIVMYIWGGPGLRGFNYVLIIGVLVGTYSSIGIAAPLLYGARSETATQNPKDKKNGLKK